MVKGIVNVSKKKWLVNPGQKDERVAILLATPGGASAIFFAPMLIEPRLQPNFVSGQVSAHELFTSDMIPGAIKAVNVLPTFIAHTETLSEAVDGHIAIEILEQG